MATFRHACACASRLVRAPLSTTTAASTSTSTFTAASTSRLGLSLGLRAPLLGIRMGRVPVGLARSFTQGRVCRKNGRVATSDSCVGNNFNTGFDNSSSPYATVMHGQAQEAEASAGGAISTNPDRLFAVVCMDGTQYKVTPGDVVVTDKLSVQLQSDRDGRKSIESLTALEAEEAGEEWAEMMSVQKRGKRPTAEVGHTLALNDVLLIGGKDRSFVGRPFLPGARVTAVVEEQTYDKKVIVFKKRRRKASQSTNGYRRMVTLLRIQDIEFDAIKEA